MDQHNEIVAKSFLAAYWKADIATALRYCEPDSVIELSRSIPILTPAPVTVVLPLMFRDIYTRFKNEHFEAEIDSVLAGENSVLVEYTARGTLANNCDFECAYAVVFWLRNRLIHRLRVYSDTRYIAPLLAT